MRCRIGEDVWYEDADGIGRRGTVVEVHRGPGFESYLVRHAHGQDWLGEGDILTIIVPLPAPPR